MDTLLVLAVLPAAVLLAYVYKMDPVEKEPPGLLGKLLLFGVLSTAFAIALEQAGSYLFLDSWSGSQVGYMLVENFVVVAVVEEGCKYFFLRLGAWNDRAFDYVFDGIVYAVFVSLGFAIAENISYVFSYGFSTGVVRAFTAIPGHAVFAVFMGYYFGRAKYAAVAGKRGVQMSNMLLAFAVPVFCHGMYDYLASMDGDAYLLAFFAFLVGMAFVGYRLVKRAAAQALRIR